MSSPSADSLKTEIDQGRMRVGNQFQAATGLPVTANQIPYVDSNSNLATATLTASQLVYSNSSSVPVAGVPPFALAMAAAATTVSVFTVSGTSTLSADEIMHNTLVAGAGVTTWTKTGFIQVDITDAGGNITNGKHYIQFGTLT